MLGFVPDEWIKSLDYSTLEKIPGNYVTADFRDRADDVVWRVKVGEAWVYLYLLIEFQSEVDRYMALRVMVYAGLLYQDLIKRKEVLNDGRLPPVLPIVLYNGKNKWNAATDVADLLPPVPAFLSQFKPAMKFLLIDENTYAESELASLKNLVAAVFRIEHPATPEAVQNLIGLLNDWLSDNPELRRIFARWIRATLMRRSEYRILMPEVNDLQELKVMLSDKLEEWAKGYKAEGRMEGRMEGHMEGLTEGVNKGRMEGIELTLERLLARRFGPLPEWAITRAHRLSVDELQDALDKILDAKSIEEVFESSKPH